MTEGGLAVRLNQPLQGGNPCDGPKVRGIGQPTEWAPAIMIIF
ncbi:hypothetical protein [Arthrobacter sp. ZGTC131]|nr:hypothetical protein [Arthrobacter sp. ZGTC131]